MIVGDLGFDGATVLDWGAGLTADLVTTGGAGLACSGTGLGVGLCGNFTALGFGAFGALDLGLLASPAFCLACVLACWLMALHVLFIMICSNPS